MNQPEQPIEALLDEVDAYFGWRLSDGDRDGLHHQVPDEAIKAVQELSRELRQRIEREQRLVVALQLLQKHVHGRHCDPHPMGQSELCKVASDAIAGVTGDESEENK